MERFKLQRMEVCPVGPEYNTAEWLIRGRTPDELNKGSHWWKGPPILYQPLDDWGSERRAASRRFVAQLLSQYNRLSPTMKDSVISIESFG